MSYIQSGQYVACMLDEFIELDNGATAPTLLLEKELQLPQLIKSPHI